MSTTNAPNLCNDMGETIRPATREEARESLLSGAEGWIEVDGQRCYVEGEDCDLAAFVGATTGYVLVEIIPRQWRSSHAAAQNSGAYPDNGSMRGVMTAADAECLLDWDGDWSHAVRDATPHDFGYYDRMTIDEAEAV